MIWFQLLLMRFVQKVMITVFVTGFSLGALAAEGPLCRDVFSGLPREQRRILDYLYRINDSLSEEARYLFEVPEKDELAGLKKLYSLLAEKGGEWSSNQSLTDAEVSYIRSHVKRGYEILKQGDAYELSLYRRNELLDISNRVEKLIATAVAKSLLNRDSSTYEKDRDVISAALEEHNTLSMLSVYSVDSALSNYKTFSPQQIEVLLSLAPEETGGSRFYGENTRRLKAVGFSTAEASSLIRSIIQNKSTAGCCGKGCRTCPKSIGLRRSIQDRLDRP